MIIETKANSIGQEWVNAWNGHDIDAIMEHYADDVVFTSPFVIAINNDPSGTLHSKSEVKAYFERALKAYPNLKFELFKILTSVNSMVVYYRSVKQLYAAEFMEFNAEGKICRVVAHYCEP